MSPKNPIYSEAFKWKVVQDVLSGTITKEEARRVYSIKGNCTVLYWMRAFSGVKDYRSGGHVVEDSSEMAQTHEQIKQADEIARLKQEVNTERLRADLWQKAVEVAEEELGVDIKKKFGVRPSPDANNG